MIYHWRLIRNISPSYQNCNKKNRNVRFWIVSFRQVIFSRDGTTEAKSNSCLVQIKDVHAKLEKYSNVNNFPFSYGIKVLIFMISVALQQTGCKICRICDCIILKETFNLNKLFSHHNQLRFYFINTNIFNHIKSTISLVD